MEMSSITQPQRGHEQKDQRMIPNISRVGFSTIAKPVDAVVEYVRGDLEIALQGPNTKDSKRVKLR